MKILIFSVISFVCSISYAQNLNSAQLVKLLHKKNIQEKIRYLKEASIDPIKIIEDSQLFEKLGIVYSQQYTSSEMELLVAFYKTNLGRKLLKNRVVFDTKVDQILIEWEMKQLGQEIPDLDEFLIEEELENVKVNEQALENAKQVNTFIKEIPEVKTLEEFKKLIKNNIDLLYDVEYITKSLGIKSPMEKEMDSIERKESNKK